MREFTKKERREEEMMLWKILISFMAVMGILGVLVNDIIWKEIGYLFVTFLMVDLLYGMYYKRYAKSEKNGGKKNG